LGHLTGNCGLLPPGSGCLALGVFVEPVPPLVFTLRRALAFIGHLLAFIGQLLAPVSDAVALISDQISAVSKPLLAGDLGRSAAPFGFGHLTGKVGLLSLASGCWRSVCSSSRCRRWWSRLAAMPPSRSPAWCSLSSATCSRSSAIRISVISQALLACQLAHTAPQGVLALIKFGNPASDLTGRVSTNLSDHPPYRCDLRNRRERAEPPPVTSTGLLLLVLVGPQRDETQSRDSSNGQAQSDGIRPRTTTL
jgi:hypothetical protein